MAKQVYGYDKEGRVLVPPKGFRLLEEYEEVPNGYLTYIDNWEGGSYAGGTRSRGTMTPIYACVSGCYQAFAVPEATPPLKSYKPAV